MHEMLCIMEYKKYAQFTKKKSFKNNSSRLVILLLLIWKTNLMYWTGIILTKSNHYEILSNLKLEFKYKLTLKTHFNVYCIPQRVDLNLFHKINEKEIWPLFDKEFELRFPTSEQHNGKI